MTSHDLARILSTNSSFELRPEFGASSTLWDLIKHTLAAPISARVLPRDLGKQGKYAVGKGYTPKVNDDVDFYDRRGAKRYGIIARIAHGNIWINVCEDGKVLETHQFEMVDDTL